MFRGTEYPPLESIGCDGEAITPKNQTRPRETEPSPNKRNGPSDPQIQQKSKMLMAGQGTVAGGKAEGKWISCSILLL